MTKQQVGEPRPIQVEELTKQYGHVTALAGVSLDVTKGKICGLLGANGAGKTTLIKTLVGSTRPTSGRVRVLGMDPVSERRKLREKIGFMPQKPALYEDLSARDNIRFFAQAHDIRDREKRIDEILDFTDLTARQHDLVYGFSGGMKQRVSLACAMVHRPEVLLLDEPSAGVDPRLRESFWKHFRELAAQGVTILVSTHHMDEALNCDWLAVMRDGVVLAGDSPQSLLWTGRSAVKVWRNGTMESKVIRNYPEQLPGVLQAYNLDPKITRIEIEEDTLETIILGLIKEREQ